MSAQTKIHVATIAMVFITVGGLAWAAALPARAASVRQSTPGDLFYNQYVPPVGPGSVGAQLYPCPRPTPPLVGHTYITYPPLAPQEFLYRHARYYTTLHDDAPPTRTSVHWNHRWW
jgi:hypothetical protein